MVEWFVKAVPENPASKRKLIIAASAGVALVAVVGTVWSNATSGSGELVVAESVAVTDAPSSLDSPLFVQVVGAVENPGVYELPADSRVMDAVALAGGLTDKADAASVNLARIVQDGEQIIVGVVGSAQPAKSATPSRININAATVHDLDTLPRIGLTMAERIVAFRDEHGPFGSLEALLDVPGIGELTLAGLRDKITL